MLLPHYARWCPRCRMLRYTATPGPPVAGPIPRSWAAAAAPPKATAQDPAWRAAALSLFFAHDSSNGIAAQGRRRRVPPLTELCLHAVLQHYGTDADFLAQLAPYLAPQHRRQLMRMCAVQRPLGSPALLALLGGERSADGEVVVVGLRAFLRPDFFREAVLDAREAADADGQESPAEAVWDADVGDAGPRAQSLTALAVLNTSLSIPTVLALPPSLTRLALVHLSAPIPLHRLPDKCPLLELLDVSFNEWLGQPAWGEEKALERVAWSRWEYLKVLGCRASGVTREELKKVNEGRWEDVTIV
ncbi:hypothetical protein BC834DRAFT_855267, partial [Gloeopeniophorella convolvens]